MREGGTYYDMVIRQMEQQMEGGRESAVVEARSREM